MQRFFIYIAYDGTIYHGWQKQPNATSVQQCLTNALNIVLRSDIPLVGAGRTDTGVHARVMVVHFDFEGPIDCIATTERLNRLLPPDISVYKIIEVRNDVHARFNPLSRTYKYYITTAKTPFNRNYHWHIYFTPDFEAMNLAAGLLLKHTDFTSFSRLHNNAKTNFCHISQAEWTKTDKNEWVFTIKADRFLRNMVRAIVGTLLDVGRGKLGVDDFRNIILQKDRCKAGSSAPAKGLFLYDIEYPDNITDINSAL